MNNDADGESYVTFGGVFEGSTTGDSYELKLDTANKSWWTVDLNDVEIFG